MAANPYDVNISGSPGTVTSGKRTTKTGKASKANPYDVRISMGDAPNQDYSGNQTSTAVADQPAPEQTPSPKAQSLFSKIKGVGKELVKGAVASENTTSKVLARLLPGGQNDIKEQNKSTQADIKNQRVATQLYQQGKITKEKYNQWMGGIKGDINQNSEAIQETAKSIPTRGQAVAGVAGTAADILTAGTLKAGKTGLVSAKTLTPILKGTGTATKVANIAGKGTAFATAGALNAASAGGTKKQIAENAALGVAFPLGMHVAGKVLSKPAQTLFSKIRGKSGTAAETAAKADALHEAGIMSDEAHAKVSETADNIAQHEANPRTMKPAENTAPYDSSPSVLQIIDKNTGKKEFKVIDPKEYNSVVDAVDGNTNNKVEGIAGKEIDGKVYHITASSPEKMQAAGFEHSGTATAKDIPGAVAEKPVATSTLPDSVSVGKNDTYYHGTSKTDAESIVKNGFNPKLAKGKAPGDQESPYALFASKDNKANSDHSAGTYGDTVVTVKPKESATLLDSNSKTWTDTMGQSHGSEESAKWAKELQGRGYDGIVKPNGEITIFNHDKFTYELPSKKPTVTPPKVKSTPTIGVPKMAQNTRKAAIKAKMIYGFDKTFNEMPDYDRVQVKDQQAKAVDLVLNSPDEAYAIAMGHKAPPNGVLSNSVYVAMKEYAKSTGDVNLMRDLATKSELPGRATGMGQELRMLVEKDPNDPIKKIKELADTRKAVVERKTKTTYAKAEAKAIKEITPAVQQATRKITRQDWADFITSIKCP